MCYKIVRYVFIYTSLCLLLLGAASCNYMEDGSDVSSIPPIQSIPSETSIQPYSITNDNVPYFTNEEKKSVEPFEEYSELDSLGRCGTAYANICKELMPTEKRGAIGKVKPSGWHLVKYDCVDGKYLYNRCHLIGYQLAGENANERNLITGTRYMNVQGMLPFENEVADYVNSTGNHVLYRVTPIYEGGNLLADGVSMEAWSVEDNGKGVCYNVIVYNIQPGVGIDYATGESWLLDEEPFADDADNNTDERADEIADDNADSDGEYILNTNTRRFHRPDCSSVYEMLPKNKKQYTGSRQGLIDDGYKPCGNCRP